MPRLQTVTSLPANSVQQVWNSTTASFYPVAADFNGDGKEDLSVSRSPG